MLANWHTCAPSEGGGQREAAALRRPGTHQIRHGDLERDVHLVAISAARIHDEVGDSGGLHKVLELEDEERAHDDRRHDREDRPGARPLRELPRHLRAHGTRASQSSEAASAEQQAQPGASGGLRALRK